MRDRQKKYGVGLEWANSIENKLILDSLDRLSCFELIPENFFDNRHPEFLAALKRADIPVLVHGVEISIGTVPPIKQKHLERIFEVMDRVTVANLSDHLSMTEAGGIEIGQLTPLPWTLECVDSVCKNIDNIMEQIRVPFLIENITNRFVIPNTELTETRFINLILNRTGAQMLLDLNNIHTNSTNFNFDPYEWIDQLNLNKVSAIHLAGGVYDEDGTLLDSHDNAVPERVWDLFRYVCKQITPRWTIVERTGNQPPFEMLLGEVERAKAIIEETIVQRHPTPNIHMGRIPHSQISLVHGGIQ